VKSEEFFGFRLSFIIYHLAPQGRSPALFGHIGHCGQKRKHSPTPSFKEKNI
jgi:hypothetical protein